MNLDQFERGRGEKKVWGGIQVSVQGELKYRIESQTTGRMCSVERGVFSVSRVSVCVKQVHREIKVYNTQRSKRYTSQDQVRSSASARPPPRYLTSSPS